MAMIGTILVAEDDPVQLILLRKMLSDSLPYDVVGVDSGTGVLAALKDVGHENVKLVILDIEMPGLDGIDTLQLLREQSAAIPVMMLTASESIGDAVRAMKMGAIDFIRKPPHPEHLKVSVINAIRMQSLQNEVSRMKRTQEGITTFDDMVGAKGGLASVVAMGRKAANADIPVLIHGETGVGKELVARAVHGESSRAGRAFIAVNCGAIPKDLVESTLFGHEKGSFTGAIAKSIGKFREAEGGTIFLDEVGELPQDAQVKLLRVLQQHEVEPVGAGKAVPINVRIISATNRNLKQEVREGRFREDLYFRLDVLSMRVPSLRERAEDIPTLARYFIEQFSVTDNLPIKELTPEAERELAENPWPGNVRMLQNTIRRAMILSEGQRIDAEDLRAIQEVESENIGEQMPAMMKARHMISLLDEKGYFKPVETIEAEAMREALVYTDYNVTRAADAIGMAKSTFYKKMTQYGIKP